MLVLWLALIVALLAPVSVASTVFESGCTTMSGEAIIVSQSFNSLLPEGMDAACPGVAFRDNSWIVLGIEGGADGHVSVHGAGQISVWAALTPTAYSDPTFSVRFGESWVEHKTSMVTIPRPPGTSAIYAELVTRDLYYGSGDWWGELGKGHVSFDWNVPYTIRYGVPFAVSVIGRMSVGGEIPNWYLGYPCCEWFDPAGDRDMYALYEAVPIPVSIPEPSTRTLFIMAAIIGAGVWVRRERFAR